MFPTVRPTLSKFFKLSYFDKATGEYGKGMEDWYLVGFWVIVFTLLRASAIEYLFFPFARKNGIRTHKALVRFAEQAWLLLYYTFFWTLGMHLYHKSKYWLDLKAMWTDYPVRQLDGVFKWYYLVQTAFWLQQIFVINIEERRKDHIQMYTHHIVTSLLLMGSYGFHCSQVGNVILCLMDVVDILLPAAKMLKYLGYQTVCDIMFGLFMVVWFIGRHVFYMMVCWSIYYDIPKVVRYGRYLPDVKDPIPMDQLKNGAPLHELLLKPFWYNVNDTYWTPRIRDIFLGLLLFLQVITIIWFFMICRVAAKVLKGGEADDTRSDDEGAGEEEEEDDDETWDEKETAQHISKKEHEMNVLLDRISKDGLRGVGTGCASGVVSGGNLGAGPIN